MAETKTPPTAEKVSKGAPPTEPTKSFVPEPKEQKDTRPQSYVHLANGTVMRCYDEDLPTASGTNAPQGFWRDGNKLFQVIGVYPVETEVED